MDRVAQSKLAVCAAIALHAEQLGAWDRATTRKHLEEAARKFGFPENEISAAIDTALGGR